MPRNTHQLFAIAPIILCFMGTQLSAAIVDSGSGAPRVSQSVATGETSPTPSIAEDVALGSGLRQAAPLMIPNDLFAADTELSRTFAMEGPLASSAFAQYGRRGRGRNNGARAAIILGAAAAIAGTAVLVYANRPDCSTHPTPGGCGYGTKVVGTAVLSTGVVALLVGALTWR